MPQCWCIGLQIGMCKKAICATNFVSGYLRECILFCTDAQFCRFFVVIFAARQRLLITRSVMNGSKVWSQRTGQQWGGEDKKRLCSYLSNFAFIVLTLVRVECRVYQTMWWNQFSFLNWLKPHHYRYVQRVNHWSSVKFETSLGRICCHCSLSTEWN